MDHTGEILPSSGRIPVYVNTALQRFYSMEKQLPVFEHEFLWLIVFLGSDTVDYFIKLCVSNPVHPRGVSELTVVVWLRSTKSLGEVNKLQ